MERDGSMIRQLNSDEIKRINKFNSHENIISVIQTALAVLAVAAMMLACWALISGRAAV